jgi:hypothetical protein
VRVNSDGTTTPLAVTGSTSTPLVVTGLVLLFLGAAVVIVTRLRQRQAGA